MLYDSNILIYFTNPDYAERLSFVKENRITIWLITKLEVLGYWRISETDLALLTIITDRAAVLELTPAVIDEAIRLRQQGSMSLGDAIVAATALLNGLRLATHNTKDFEWIDGLEVYDPIGAE